MANNIKEELRNDFNNSLQALQLKENIENISPQYYIPNQHLSIPNTSTMTDYNLYMANMYSPTATESVLAIQQYQNNQPKYVQHLNAELQALRKEIAGITLRNQNGGSMLSEMTEDIQRLLCLLESFYL